MKNISIFIPTLRPGGAEKQAVTLAVLLSAEYDVNMIVFHGETSLDSRNTDRLKGYPVNMVPLSGPFTHKLKLLSDILRKTDILFNYLTFCDFVGSIVARRCDVKRVYSGIRNSDLPAWKIILEKFAANLSTKVIFNSFFGQKTLGRRISNPAKQVVIPNCLPSSSAFSIRPDKDVKTIITVARFVPQKDFDTALKSICRLSELRRDFKYIIVGYGELESRIRQTIIDLKLEEFVTLAIKPDNVAQYLKDADVYLSTSLFEGTSNSLMEAMDAGLPIVSTDVGDASYFISEKNGFLVGTRDCESIAKKLFLLLSSCELRNSKGRCSNSEARARFSRDSFLEKYKELIVL